jgi:hypothetical protein
MGPQPAHPARGGLALALALGKTGPLAPAGAEAHDRPLVDAENPVQFPLPQQAQVRIGREGAVAHQHVAGAQVRVQLRHAGHVVHAQRTHQHVLPQAAAGVHQQQQGGHGKAAAFLLSCGLAEVRLQLRRVGHGGVAAVHQEEPMPVPQARIVTGIVHRPACLPGQVLEHHQRQADTGLAIGTGGEVHTRQQAHMAAGGIAGEHLHDQQVHGGGGVK